MDLKEKLKDAMWPFSAITITTGFLFAAAVFAQSPLLTPDNKTTDNKTTPVVVGAPSEIPAIKLEAPEDKNQAEIKIGRIDLSNEIASDKGHAMQVRIGKRTNSQVKIYRDQVFGKRVIGIDTKFQVAGAEKVNVSYFVVFQNSAGNVIGAAGGSDEIDPGMDYGWSNSAVIPLPEKRFGEIAYYQIVLYESDKPVGTVGGATAKDTKEN